MFILPLHHEMHIGEFDIRHIGAFAGTPGFVLVGPSFVQQIGIGIAGAIGIKIDLTVFECYLPQGDVVVEQTFPEIAGDKDVGCVEEVMVVLLPGAVPHRHVGETYGDGGKIAEEGDLQGADMRVTLQIAFNSILRFIQDGSLMELDIDSQGYPGKK